MIQELKVGTLHHTSNPTPGQECCRVEFTTTCVDLVHYLNSPSAVDFKVFQREALRLGVFESTPGMPFIVGEFQDVLKWSFDAPLDVHKIHSSHPRWWESDEFDNVMFNILVDARSNKIVALRQLGLSVDFVHFLKQSLVRQKITLPTTRDVDSATVKSIQNFTTSRMLNRMRVSQYFSSRNSDD